MAIFSDLLLAGKKSTRDRWWEWWERRDAAARGEGVWRRRGCQVGWACLADVESALSSSALGNGTDGWPWDS
jgi:hypothetical protein